VSTLQRLLSELASGPRALALLEGLLTIGLVAVAAALAFRAIPSLVRRALRPRGDRVLDTARALTLQPLLESVLRYTIYFIAAVMVLRAAGVDATAVLASAGVVGLAVGFGAQHLIRDVISGFFILAEGLIQVGDIITVGEHAGQVERINIRTTQVRKYSGELWTIPNGQITVFGNASRGYMRAIVDIPLSYRADLDRAMVVMQRVADEWAAGSGAAVLSPPEVHSVLQFGDTRIRLRVVVTVPPGAQVAAERELRRRLKLAFDREGIGGPFGRGAGEPSPETA
jgi:moderate conductance mechanosensitive channel